MWLSQEGRRLSGSGPIRWFLFASFVGSLGRAQRNSRPALLRWVHWGPRVPAPIRGPQVALRIVVIVMPLDSV